MMCLDVCGWDTPDNFFCYMYILQAILSIIGFIVNLIICIFAFSGDRFSPHTAMTRALLWADVMSSFAYIADSISSLLQRNADIVLGPPQFEYVSISTCASNKPQLFFLQIGRQWRSVIILIMGVERYLFITYPLWFKVVRVRRLPILIFTTCYVLLSAGIAYTNALVIDPTELTHFSCEVTWAFGDNYGWCQSGMVIVAITVAFLLNYYARYVVRKDTALLHFGNNRPRLNNEKRKIRKAMWLISATLITCVIPQVLLVVLRALDQRGLQKWKLLVSQLFLLKFIANFVLMAKLSRVGPQLSFFAPRFCCSMTLRKARVDHNDSIASVSYYVN
ncbi:unnamed protein product [Bursaphelenchus okinawaensis]|uniref:G_PROTEIN_RECEP_F1_2 domain-containing protein n=1 Tax=Bursaphelenchus okinawaensis TaxID=465554 RepID=A0A811KYC6_9BILA|nr:unnamed protein product [Bursaphelenchus okinawaensis]CAG9113716.1 unnamed protein product [Bursaphelenchus okinawaensis]